MIGLALALLAGTQSPSGSDDALALARAGPDSSLVEYARRRPDDVRDALRRLLAQSVDSGGSALATADRLAGAYQSAWRDSFFVRQVTRFRSLPPDDRRTKVTADSLRLAGNAALGSAGIDAAMRVWRESLSRCAVVADTACMAAALGNLGGAHYRAGQLDSAESYLSRSRSLAELAGDFRTAGNAMGTLGLVARDRGELRRASELLSGARPLRERAGDARGLAADQQNLGLIAKSLGDLAGARRAFEAALAANRAAGRDEPAATNLVNLGNVASLEGDYRAAAARYREALAIYREHGNQLETAATLHSIGLLALQRGDYRAAVSVLVEAVGLYRQTGPLLDEVAARHTLGTARAAVGDLQGARRELSRAVSRAGGALSAAEGGASVRAGLAVALGDLAVLFNQLGEAERQYGSAERLAQAAEDDVQRAAAQQGLGFALLMRGNHRRAEAVFDLALRAQQTAGDRRGAAQTRLLAGYAAGQRGDTAAARRAIRQALDSLRGLRDAAGSAAALGALADLEARSGLPLTAESLYQRGLDALRDRPAPAVSWQLYAGLAAALRSRGALPEAAAALRSAIEQVERMASGVTLEERRAAFLADKWDVYLELALLERTRGRATAAFEVSERLRARQMLDLLARGRVAGEATRPDLVEREQDLRRRIGELTEQLASAPDGDPGLRGAPSPEAGALREALAQAQDAYRDALLEMREARPDYAALVRGDVASAQDVMRALRPDEALLEYLVGDSTTTVFIVTADTVAALDLNVTGRTLAELVDFARARLSGPVTGAGRNAWRPPMQRLFRMLVSPVEGTGLLAGKQRLLIAPHAELHYLPFAALVRPEAPGELLLERHVIEYLPSASVWLRLRNRPAPSSGGVLALAPRSAALPGSREEVAGIGRRYGGQARVLVGASASEQAFRALSPGQSIVHLATFGVLNRQNPLFSYVELGPSSGEDGRLEVHELFGLSLNARLLVLSACQTGLGSGALADVPPGDDWVGLVQGFLQAGAANVLATLWPVEDIGTARLMDRFYAELSGGRDESEALALAQRATLRGPRAHPFHWAGFALVRGQ